MTDAAGGLAALTVHVERVAAPVREQVLVQLRDAIVERRLAPGQRLIERELTRQTGVSRTTIREVLRELAAEGLVVTTPHKGTAVASISLDRAAELYEVRAELESMAVRQFAARATDEDRAALRRAFEEIEATSKHPAPGAAMLAAKKHFYDALLAGAGNQTLAEIVESLQTRVSFLRAMSMTHPGRCAETVGEVREILDALDAGDPDRAAEASAFHVRQAAVSMRNAVADSDVPDETEGS